MMTTLISIHSMRMILEQISIRTLIIKMQEEAISISQFREQKDFVLEPHMIQQVLQWSDIMKESLPIGGLKRIDRTSTI
jgi:hypothetical protein